MDRKKFIALSGAFIGTTFLNPYSTLAQSKNTRKKNVRFGIITDIHNDIMHDGESRLDVFLKASEEEEVDFIIQLGDFCMVKESNKKFVELWNSSKIEKHHALGNHDMDNCTKEEFMQFVGMSQRYYSFEKGDYKFIILDPNNIYSDDKYTHYANGNYYIDLKKRAHVDPEQLEWLKKELNNSDKQCILFSHQSLERCVQNRAEIQQILENTNKTSGYNKVIAAFSGHDHTSYKKEINGINYIQINSSSNQWVGNEYACKERFSDEINEKHPSLKFTIPYKDSLYALVEVNKRRIAIDGVKSEFIAPTPEDLNIPIDIHDLPLIAEIKDMNIPLRKK